MAGYDLVQADPSRKHNEDCPCRTCKPQRVRARHCRICGAQFDGPIGDDAMRVATADLALHMDGHTREQIVRVYVLGEPWWHVMTETITQATSEANTGTR